MEVQQNGCALGFVKNQTPELCILAVQQTGWALKYVKKQTDSICKEAVKKSGRALQYVENQTNEICKLAVQCDGNALEFVINQNDEIRKLAIQQNRFASKYAKKIRLLCINYVLSIHFLYIVKKLKIAIVCVSLNKKHILLLDSMNSKTQNTQPKFLQDMSVSQQDGLLLWAAENDDVVLMKTLLQHGKADPASEDNKPFRMAVSNGCINVVKLLLGDERIDPTAKDIETLHWASAKGFIGILTILLNNKRVKDVALSHHYNNALERAAICGQVEAVKVILQHVKPEQFEPTDCLATLKYARTESQYPVIVNLLTELCDKITKLTKAIESIKNVNELVCKNCGQKLPQNNDKLNQQHLENCKIDNFLPNFKPEKYDDLTKILQDVKISQHTQDLIFGHDCAVTIGVLLGTKQLDARAKRRLVNWTVKYDDVEIMRFMLENRETNPDPEVDQYVTEVIREHWLTRQQK